MALLITPSERAVLGLLEIDPPRHELARLLEVSERDLESCLAGLFARLGAATRSDAIAAARRRGLLTEDASASLTLAKTTS